jgi:hypothetical protein
MQLYCADVPLCIIQGNKPALEHYSTLIGGLCCSTSFRKVRLSLKFYIGENTEHFHKTITYKRN